MIEIKKGSIIKLINKANKCSRCNCARFKLLDSARPLNKKEGEITAKDYFSDLPSSVCLGCGKISGMLLINDNHIVEQKITIKI